MSLLDECDTQSLEGGDGVGIVHTPGSRSPRVARKPNGDRNAPAADDTITGEPAPPSRKTRPVTIPVPGR